MKKRPLQIHITDEMYQKLLKIAEEKGISIGGLIRLIVNEYFKTNKGE